LRRLHKDRHSRPKFHLIAWILFSLVLVLAACGKATPPVSPTTTERATFTPTPWLFPTETFPANPTSEPLLPTNSPTNNPIPDHYDLPAWMSDPSTNILVSQLTTDTDKLVSFLNAATGERFNVPLYPQATKYFWNDNMHFGFLSNNLQVMFIIDLNTGVVTTQAVSNASIEFITSVVNDYGYEGYLNIITDLTIPEKFRFEIPNIDHNRYFVQDTEPSGKNISVMDTQTREVIWNSHFSDDFWIDQYSWSPTNESYLAITRGKTGEFYTPINNPSLLIIDVETGEIILDTTGEFNEINWSPDGSKILYQRGFFPWPEDVHSRGYRKAPCIININNGENKCLPLILQYPVPENLYFRTTYRMSWAPDGKTIHYIYAFDPKTYNQDISKINMGNLCNYDLTNGRISCPTENINLNGRSPYTYRFSPDQQFIYFIYSDAGPFADFVGDEYDAVVKIDGTSFTTWKGTMSKNWTIQCSIGTPAWRPLP
jgi:hypothetical protein